MTWLQDIGLFFLAPVIVILCVVLTHKGTEPRGYKIVRETNRLGEVRYEVWFEYPAMFWNKYSWCLKEVFDTEQLAIEYVARQQEKKREIIKTGTF